ncbi:hypothetical protein [Enterococcus rivorum]|uniref:Uncharacterized protein n=1 Tax=Enterococcus rivorum TaxID=762845 RepID=A0A1E5L0B3_9ENTE|nr:hypothetical protein [Enterococcus rivorum]MBP2098813.1 hypothetical protein [Enterococcus rivorum]OEH83547.1 hypothetical protein BCR26_08685 [Enterococcus rivorum]
MSDSEKKEEKKMAPSPIILLLFFLGGVLFMFIVTLFNQEEKEKSQSVDVEVLDQSAEKENSAENLESLKKEWGKQSKLLEGYEEREFQSVNLLKTSKEFVEGYYTNSTDKMKENMKMLQPIMTDKAIDNLIPFNIKDKSIEQVVTRLERYTTYVHSEKNVNTAQTITLGTVSTRVNGNASYENNYVIRLTLVSDKKNSWKVDHLEESVILHDIPSEFFLGE